MNTINAMKMAFCEEIEVMRSGHSMPYHKLSLMVSLVTAIVFAILLQHQVVFDGHIAVIDLDSSSYSRELIQKLDASSYIEITEVYQKSAVKPRASARGYKAPNRGYSGFQCIV